jgi:hypothetical protein
MQALAGETAFDHRAQLAAQPDHTVRGEATGTPAGEFMGARHTGKSFKLMSIDVHTFEGGKMVRSCHISRIGWARSVSSRRSDVHASASGCESDAFQEASLSGAPAVPCSDCALLVISGLAA